MTMPLRGAATKHSELQDARDVVRRLRGLATPGESSDCAVDDTHKAGVQLFVTSWLLPQAERWLARVEGSRKARRGPKFALGDMCEIRRRREGRAGQWLDARVVEVDADGRAVRVQTCQACTYYVRKDTKRSQNRTDPAWLAIRRAS